MGVKFNNRCHTPLRIIQEISGHRTLDELYKYLEVRSEQVKGAIASLSLLTPVESYFVKPSYPDVPHAQSQPTVEPD